jgi:hypothetical protein
VLDLREKPAQEQLLRLLGGADILLDASCGALNEALRLDGDALNARYPALVTARMTPFGDDGPWKDFRGSDLIHLALGGVMMNCGYDPDPNFEYDTPPIAPQIWHAYHIAVVAKVEWHPGELCPRVGFIVTNLARPAERIVAFYNHRGTCEQYIKEGKGAIKWTRLSCRSFAANAVRLQLHALAYNLGNFMRTLAMPKTAEPWSLTSQ